MIDEEKQPLSLDEFLEVDESIDVDQSYSEELTQEQKEIKLKEIGELCEKAEEQDAKVKKLARELEEETAKFNELMRQTIPDTLIAAGMTELKLASGKKISIVDELSFNISDANRADCMKWLRDNDFDSIIKNTVTATFKKGEDEKALATYRELLSKGYDAIHKDEVHWQTMKAFLKEQCGKNVLSTEDKELFKVYEYKLAKIK